MENRAHALLAGLFMLCMGAAAALAIWWFTGAREPMARYELVTRGNVSGLNVQANVRYRGMLAGKVESIGVDPDSPQDIVVRIRLRADLPVTRGTRASLGYQGVTGLAFVLLEDDGRDPRPLEGEEGRLPRLALTPGLIEQLGSSAALNLRRVDELIGRLVQVFDDHNLARIERTLARLESAAAGIDRTFALAPETLAALRGVLSPSNLARLQTILANLERTSAEAPALAAEVRVLLGRIDATLAQAGQGLHGQTLPQLNALLEELTHTTRRAGQLADELEAAPQMLLRGRGSRIPGPGETGFADDARPAR